MNRIKKLDLGLIVALSITLVSLGGCVPSETPEGGFDWTVIIFLILILGLMYLVLVRPQRKRQKEHQQLVAELRRGDRVITAGGIYGIIETVSEDSVVIKVESGMTMRVSKTSVALKRER